MLSAISPVRGSVIATIERQVSAAQRRIRASRSHLRLPSPRGGAEGAGAARAGPPADPARTRPAAAAPLASRNWRRVGVGRSAVLIEIPSDGRSLDAGGRDSLDEAAL